MGVSAGLPGELARRHFNYFANSQPSVKRSRQRQRRWLMGRPTRLFCWSTLKVQSCWALGQHAIADYPELGWFILHGRAGILYISIVLRVQRFSCSSADSREHISTLNPTARHSNYIITVFSRPLSLDHKPSENKCPKVFGLHVLHTTI